MTSPPREQDIEIFRDKARECVALLQEYLGEDFRSLSVPDYKIARPGEVLLSKVGGIKPKTIAANLVSYLLNLDKTISDAIGAQGNPSAAVLWNFIRRFDALADTGSDLGDSENRLVGTLLEYHLALIGRLQLIVKSSLVEQLVERFAGRETLRRSQTLRPFWNTALFDNP